MLSVDAAGAQLAQHISNRLFDAHRGVFVAHDAHPVWVRLAAKPGDVIAFGNDSFSGDERAKREVAALLSWAEKNDLQPIHFGADPDAGYSWAAVLRPAERRTSILTESGRELLRRQAVDQLWRAFVGDASEAQGDPIGFRALQQAIAEAAMTREFKAGQPKRRRPQGSSPGAGQAPNNMMAHVFTEWLVTWREPPAASDQDCRYASSGSRTLTAVVQLALWVDGQGAEVPSRGRQR